MWKIVDSFQLATRDNSMELGVAVILEIHDVNYLNMVSFPKEEFHR